MYKLIQCQQNQTVHTETNNGDSSDGNHVVKRRLSAHQGVVEKRRTSGYDLMTTLHLGHVLGVFGALDKHGSITADDLSKKVDLSPHDALEWCRHAVCHGVVVQHDCETLERFSLPGHASVLEEEKKTDDSEHGCGDNNTNPHGGNCTADNDSRRHASDVLVESIGDDGRDRLATVPTSNLTNTEHDNEATHYSIPACSQTIQPGAVAIAGPERNDHNEQRHAIPRRILAEQLEGAAKKASACDSTTTDAEEEDAASSETDHLAISGIITQADIPTFITRSDSCGTTDEVWA